MDLGLGLVSKDPYDRLSAASKQTWRISHKKTDKPTATTAERYIQSLVYTVRLLTLVYICQRCTHIE